MMFEWVNDHPYTCPLLVVAQGWIRWQQWSYGCSGWVLLETEADSHFTARASVMWPRWLIAVETNWWNSRVGCVVRRLCGTQQREYRLTQTDLDTSPPIRQDSAHGQ